jgi:RHS repeat-associated protein
MKGTDTAYVEHDPVTGEALMLRTSSGMQSLYVYDGTGNPAALITSGAYTAFAYEYDPYGVETLTTNSGGNGTHQNPYLFKAGIQDRVTGWVKFGARWYNPTMGRWTQHDTLDAPLDPRNANRYAFAANDPINNSDPTGLSMEGFILGEIIGGVVGAGVATIVTGAAAPLGPGAPFLGATIGGCVSGMVGQGFENAYDDVDTSWGDLGNECSESAAWAGLGSIVKELNPL